eukprot:4439808-Pyramimonas_sp.AAC.1
MVFGPFLRSGSGSLLAAEVGRCRRASSFCAQPQPSLRQHSEVDRSPALTRRLANWLLSVRERASRQLVLRV